MGYSTGTATSMQGLHDAITSALTGAGWTLVETVSAADKVFTSPGESGTRTLVFRLTGGRLSVIPQPDHPSNWGDQIIARGYHKWNVGAPGTGVNEFGSWGPMILMTDLNTLASIYRTDKHPNEQFATFYRSSLRTWGKGCYSGRRYFYNRFTSNALEMWNFPDDLHQIASSPAIGAVQAEQGLVVRDKSNDTYYLYFVQNTASNPWRRLNLETNAVEQLTSTPGNVDLSPMVWDGDDFIYTLQTASTNFWRYTISTDTWTALTAAPTTNDAYTVDDQRKGMLYVPQAIGNWEDTGVNPTDVILVLLDDNTATTTLYRYNVNDDTWGTNLGLPENNRNSNNLNWDGEQYMWLVNELNQSIWRVDLNDGASIVAGNWTRQFNSDAVPAGTPTWESMQFMNWHPGRIQALDTGDAYDYFIHADLDRCVVVTKIRAAFTGGTDHYYWMYFGAVDSLIRSEVMTATAGATAGNLVAITVDDTSAYAAGEKVVGVDPSSGVVVGILIDTIDSATQFTATVLTDNITTGTIIGSDPDPKAVAGDTGMCVCSTDAEGFEGAGTAANYVTKFAVSDEVFDLPDTDGNIRDGQVAWPIGAFWRQLDSQLTREHRCLLKGVFYMPLGAFPAPQAEEIVKIAGVSYKVFPEYARSGFRMANANLDRLINVIIPTS